MTRVVALVVALALAFPAPTLRAQAVSAAGTTQGAETRVVPVDRSQPALQRKVTLTLRDVPLSTALRAIDLQADLRLGYAERIVPVDRRVSLVATRMSAGDALRSVLAGTGVVVRESPDGEITLVRAPVRGTTPAAPAMDTIGFGAVVGSVSGQTGGGRVELLVGAVVTVKGTSLSARTNSEGVYLFPRVPAGTRTIAARFLGHRAAEETVLVHADSGVELDFVLQSGSLRMQEMVTTATGTQRRLEIPNAITTIDVDSIVQLLPVTTVSELLATRVPGLVAQHTSGAPGAPTRLRLRGVSGIFGNNDPIFIVDGHRVYARQSDETSRSLADINMGDPKWNSALAVIDQLDVNAIERIEVVSGPSAAALYGADAANGVIVVTTKRGQPGETRWNVSVDRGVTYLPGEYPLGYYRFGREFGGGGAETFCRLSDFGCMADSLVRVQPLNDPALTMLGRGQRSNASATVSGGSETLRYRVTASGGDDQGYMKLPDVQAARFEIDRGYAAPGWMRRPQDARRLSVSSNVSARLNEQADVMLTTSLSNSRTSSTQLSSQLAEIMGTFYDYSTGIAYRPSADVAGDRGMNPSYDLVEDFYTRSLMHTTSINSGVNAAWRPRPWLSTSLDVGMNLISRQDESALPRGMSFGSDSVGAYRHGQGRTTVTSATARVSGYRELPWSTRLTLTLSADYARTASEFLTVNAQDLKAGQTSVVGAANVTSSQVDNDVTKLGVAIAPMLSRGNLYLSTGLRFDAANTYGDDRRFIGLPKLGLSWMISEEPFFPASRFLDALQLRAAYGDAGAEPNTGDRLRLYRNADRPWLDGAPVDAMYLDGLGNTELRPERVREIEGGFSAELLDSRLSLDVNGYRKSTTDAIMRVPVAPSVYGNGVTVLQNIGLIRNTGVTAELRGELLRSELVDWSVAANVGQNRQVLATLGEGVVPFQMNRGWVRPGYPVFGRWERPILGYHDVNGNGVIEPLEVQVGDSASYVGSTQPDFTAGLSTTLSLLSNALSFTANFSYSDGLTQENALFRQNQVFIRALNDPEASFAEQAAIAALGRTGYGVIQSVSTLRFESLSIAYRPPVALVERLGARGMTVMLQGTNLGLHSTYAGKDPDVNAFSTGNAVLDTGILPQPRSWQVRVNLNY
ncbi:MAG: TonB-dependent receptor plug domain-containing protein [Gemmatimonadaceae bacterium]